MNEGLAAWLPFAECLEAHLEDDGEIMLASEEEIINRARFCLTRALVHSERGHDLVDLGRLSSAIREYQLAVDALEEDAPRAVMSADTVGDERRFDPDGRAYTFSEVMTTYSHIYGEKFVLDHWNTAMLPLTVSDRMRGIMNELACTKADTLKSLAVCHRKVHNFREAVYVADCALGLDPLNESMQITRAKALLGASFYDFASAFSVRIKEILRCCSDDEDGEHSYKQLHDGSSRAAPQFLSMEMRLCLAYLAAAMSAGIWPGAATFIPLFTDAGILSSACGGLHTCDLQKSIIANLVTTLAYALQATTFIAGLSFDRWGARRIATTGTLAQFIGYGLISVASFGAANGFDAGTWWLFVLGIFLADAGSTFTSYVLFGFIWHFPQQQVFVQSLILSSIQAGACLPLILKVCMWSFGGSLGASFFVVMALEALSVIVFLGTVPSQMAYYRAAKEALGISLRPPPRRLPVISAAGKALQILSYDKTQHAICMLACGACLFFAGLYTSNASSIGAAVFGDIDAGNRVAFMQTSMTTGSGLLLVPFLGIVADWLGLRSLYTGNLLMLIAGVACAPFPSWPCQAVVCIVTGTTISTVITFQQMYCFCYAPPNRIGVVQGIVTGLTLFPAIILLGITTAWIQLLGTDYAAWMVPTTSLGIASICAMMVFWVRLFTVGFPDTVVLLKEDEAEIAEEFGCITIEEVLEVSGLPSRRALLQKLSSIDPGEIREFVQSIDKEKLKAVVARRVTHVSNCPSEVTSFTSSYFSDVDSASSDSTTGPAMVNESNHNLDRLASQQQPLRLIA